MGKARLDRGVELDVGELGAADDPFLRLGRQIVPALQIVQVFLHDDIAAAGESRVLAADEGGVERVAAFRIFGAVDKAQEIALVEIAEAVDLVLGRDQSPEPAHDLPGQLEAQIHAPRPDVEQDVARGGDCLARPAAKFAERVQLGRAWRTEEPIPHLRSERDDAGEAAFEIAKPDRAQERRKIGAQRAHRVLGLGAGVYGDDQKDRGRGQRRRHRLRQRTRLSCHPRGGHAIGLRRLMPLRGAVSAGETHSLIRRPCDRRAGCASIRYAIAACAWVGSRGCALARRDDRQPALAPDAVGGGEAGPPDDPELLVEPADQIEQIVIEEDPVGVSNPAIAR